MSINPVSPYSLDFSYNQVDENPTATRSSLKHNERIKASTSTIFYGNSQSFFSCYKKSPLSLQEAASAGQLEIIKSYPFYKNEILLEALEAAAKNGHLDVVEYFISIMIKDPRYKIKAASIAAINGHLNIVKYFSVVLFEYDNSFFNKIISSSISNNQWEVVKYLLTIKSPISKKEFETMLTIKEQPKKHEDQLKEHFKKIEMINFFDSLKSSSERSSFI